MTCYASKNSGRSFPRAAEGGLRAGVENHRALVENIAQVKEVARAKLEMPVLALGGAASGGEVLAQQRPRMPRTSFPATRSTPTRARLANVPAR